jgi:transcriptional regulator with XRE-family HTH domain
VTYAQCIEARRLLGLKQSDVAKAIGVNASLISVFETTGHLSRMKDGRDRVPKLKAFFEKAGVEFTSQVPAGARLRKVEP